MIVTRRNSNGVSGVGIRVVLIYSWLDYSYTVNTVSTAVTLIYSNNKPCFILFYQVIKLILPFLLVLLIYVIDIWWHCDVYNQHIVLGMTISQQNDIPVNTKCICDNTGWD